MQAVKIHLLCTIVATQAAALLCADKLPYFPIEISRTAASSSESYWIFLIGVALLPGYMPVVVEASTLLVFAGLFVLALCDDVRYYRLHMFGVLLVVMGCVYRVAFETKGLRWPALAAGLLQVAVIAAYGRPNITWLEVAQQQQRVLFHGVDGFESREAILPVFRVCGVLQWVVFYAFSMLF